VDIRIGILNSPREISFETAYIRLIDDKHKVYIIPTASFGYIEVGSEISRRVGFVA
jgi:hypothetical protein